VQIELLAQDFSVYAVDLRGHGMSCNAKFSSLAAEPVPVDDVMSVVKSLGLEMPLVFGHSLGGLLAALAECRYPSMWRAMFLYEPVIPADPNQVRHGLSWCGYILWPERLIVIRLIRHICLVVYTMYHKNHINAKASNHEEIRQCHDMCL
jgi:pimeloyl-ACP methyl ester carboxylesterase